MKSTIQSEAEKAAKKMMSITKDQLRAALFAWEASARAGETQDRDDVAQLPVDVVAEQSAEHLWNLLEHVGSEG